jgi:hypothetical protein
MIKHEVLELKEQKYVGIKTLIKFSDIEQVNFSQLHKNVLAADIQDIDPTEHYMAIDTDFTEESFSYTPLVAVTSFEQNKDFTHFIRNQGLYCAFEVSVKELNPTWFSKVFAYIEEQKINVAKVGFDLEYYNENYLGMKSKVNNDEDRGLKILLKIQE